MVEFSHRHFLFLRLALSAGRDPRTLARRSDAGGRREFPARLGLADFQAFALVTVVTFSSLDSYYALNLFHVCLVK